MKDDPSDGFDLPNYTTSFDNEVKQEITRHSKNLSSYDS